MATRTRPGLTYVSPGVYLNEDGYYVDRTGSLVYFIREQGGARRIKIGFTTNLRARFAQISTGSSERLEVIHTEPGGKAREGYLHGRWRRFHHHLEWHNPGDPILEYVKDAPSGRRGRDSFSLPVVPWRKVLRLFGVAPRGAWRLTIGLLAYAVTRKKKYLRTASIGGTAGAAAVGAHFVLDPAVAVPVMTLSVLGACLLEGSRS